MSPQNLDPDRARSNPQGGRGPGASERRGSGSDEDGRGRQRLPDYGDTEPDAPRRTEPPDPRRIDVEAVRPKSSQEEDVEAGPTPSDQE